MTPQVEFQGPYYPAEVALQSGGTVKVTPGQTINVGAADAIGLLSADQDWWIELGAPGGFALGAASLGAASLG